MRLRNVTFVILALCGLPAASSAGLIEFGFATGNVTVSSGTPQGFGLAPFEPPGPVFSFDTSSNTPVTLPAVLAEPPLIPPPAGLDIKPDGTAHWTANVAFGVDVWVMDFASGQPGVAHLTGEAHVSDTFTTGVGWTGTTYFWFQDHAQLDLGGNEYTVWGTNTYTPGPATVGVWVGPNPPVPQYSPEPGTFALAALGFIPLAVRRLRKSRLSNAAVAEE